MRITVRALSNLIASFIKEMLIGLDGMPLLGEKTGVWHYTFELARHLALEAKSDQFELISHLPWTTGTGAQINGFPPNLKYSHIEVNRLSHRWFLIGLPSHIRRHRISLFHGTNFEIPLWSTCPLILTIHDLSVLLYPETHLTAHVRRMRRRLPIMARRADMIIAPTKSVGEEISRHLKISLDKIAVVPHAPRSCFYPVAESESVAAKKLYGVEDEFILYVGTIEPRKNLISVVKALEKIARETSYSPQMVFAGPRGWLYDEFFAYVENSRIRDRLCFTGHVSDESLRALYSSCRFLIYPSFYEGFGLPPLEAMACGVPVIASRIPALIETTRGAARLCAPTDIDELAHCMTELLSNKPLRTELSQAGIKRAAELSWSKTAVATYEVYRHALRKQPAVS